MPVERVVRFGRLKDEVRIEAEAFAADLVALAAPLSPGPWHRALAWYLGRVALASKTPVVLLPVSAPGAGARPARRGGHARPLDDRRGPRPIASSSIARVALSEPDATATPALS